MAAKKYMTSYYVLYACFAIIVLFFAAFFGYGYDNPVGDYNAPVCTEGLMWLMYGMFAVTCLLALWSVVRGIKISMGSKGGDISGVPGKEDVFGIETDIATKVVPEKSGA